jgi:lipocalin-like protein
MPRLLPLSLFIFGLALPAAPQQGPPAKSVVGAWRLISVEGNDRLRSKVYDRPTGMIIYDTSGHVAVQIAAIGDRKPFTKGVAAATLQEKAAAYDSYIAYYGTYTIDAKAGTIIHHLRDSLTPNNRGRDFVRYFEFQGEDRILLVPAEDGKGGLLSRQGLTYKLLWERIK